MIRLKLADKSKQTESLPLPESLRLAKPANLIRYLDSYSTLESIVSRSEFEFHLANHSDWNSPPYDCIKQYIYLPMYSSTKQLLLH